MTNEFSETAGHSPAGVTPPNAADGSEALNERMTRIEAQLERLALALETSTTNRTDAAAAAEPVDGVELGGRAKAETLHRDSTAKRVTAKRVTAKRVTDSVAGSMAGADATVRDWFDRRPFLFMTGLFIAALVVFQIID